MPRSMTVKNVYDKRVRRLVTFSDDRLTQTFGLCELKGLWVIYGIEKNGKTWFTLQLAKDLSYNHKVAYISAEEGTDLSFQNAMRRAGITTANRILFDEYLPIEELISKFSKPRTADILIIDNATIYADDLKQFGGLLKFIEAFPGKLIILLCHEERREPYPAVAKMATKLAKVIVHVVGLMSTITSRYSPAGGNITIDENGAALYWGDAQ